MPAEIVSLNQYRKAKQKAEKEGQSAANRIRSGRTRGERQADQDTMSKTETAMDGKKLDDDPLDENG